MAFFGKTGGAVDVERGYELRPIRTNADGETTFVLRLGDRGLQFYGRNGWILPTDPARVRFPGRDVYRLWEIFGAETDHDTIREAIEAYTAGGQGRTAYVVVDFVTIEGWMLPHPDRR